MSYDFEIVWQSTLLVKLSGDNERESWDYQTDLKMKFNSYN